MMENSGNPSKQPPQNNQNPSPAAADGQTGQPTVIDEIAAFIQRFVFLPGESLYRLIATWVVVTYLKDSFEYVPYLFIHSPEPSCGKSLLLEILAELVRGDTGVLISPTQAVLFHTAKAEVQLLDEVDSWTNKDDLKAILNAGFKRGGVVKRMRQGGESGYTPVSHPVFGPRALAGIGTSILDRTTKDRTFIIPMKRQTKEERRERFRTHKLRQEITALRKKIETWAKEFGSHVQACYNEGHFPYLEEFRDRTIDISKPLVAIHEIAYRDHPGLLENRVDLLEAIAGSRKEEDAPILDSRVLRELAKLARSEDPLVGNASELAEKMTEKPELWKLSAILRRYGFETKSVRQGDSVRYRYSLPRRELEDLVVRYAPEEPEAVPEAA